MKLYDIAKVIRSKNAGPFTLTLDLIFDNLEDFHKVLDSSCFNEKTIAELYAAEQDKVKIYPFEAVKAVKITMPRRTSSGAPGDNDVYGSQQHLPLARLVIY